MRRLAEASSFAVMPFLEHLRNLGPQSLFQNLDIDTLLRRGVEIEVTEVERARADVHTKRQAVVRARARVNEARGVARRVTGESPECPDQAGAS